MDGESLALLAVKTRSSNALGWPQESITSSKKRRLIAGTAETYLQSRTGLPPDPRTGVVGLDVDRLGQTTRIEPIDNAVSNGLKHCAQALVYPTPSVW